MRGVRRAGRDARVVRGFLHELPDDPSTGNLPVKGTRSGCRMKLAIEVAVAGPLYSTSLRDDGDLEGS